MKEIKLVYEQIRDYIEKEALEKLSGEYLKSEVSYSMQFHVSRPTIRKAVEELINKGIVKRLPGKGLVVGSKEEPMKTTTYKIAILVPFVSGDGFFYELMMGCISVLNEQGCNYSIYNCNDMQIKKDAIQFILHNHYSGVIMTAYEQDDFELIHELKALGIPLILVDNPMEDSKTPCVISDDYMGGYIAADYLIQHGHKKIVYITRNKEIRTVKLRLKGHLSALADHQITLTDAYILKLDKDEDIFEALSKLEIEYTAICGYSDLPVIMAYNYLVEKYNKVPSDISLLGYGNFKASEILQIPLTTISIPTKEMGVQAAVMMMDHIVRNVELSKKVLQVALVERESVANRGVHQNP